MAIKLRNRKIIPGKAFSWWKRLSLKGALVCTTLLCTAVGFGLIYLETAVLSFMEDTLYSTYVSPYFADETISEKNTLYTVSPDGTLLYVESTMPYAYVDPETGDIYPIETTSPSQFIPEGPLRFLYQNVEEIAISLYLLTALLCFAADAWWFYRWKIKSPLAVLNAASEKIAQNDLDFQVVAPSGDELGRLCQSFEKMRASLEENNRSLWAAVEERKRLNAAFSHDLRTPLTVLQGYSDFLLEAFPSGDLSPQKTMDTVMTMKRSLIRLQRYVESMNSLQRLDDVKTHKESVPFSSLCDELKETGEILGGKERFLFSSEGEGTLFIDTELVFQVFENMLSNACRYAKSKIWATAQVTAKYLTLTVSDDGPGFPPPALKRATEPYYRGEKNVLEGDLHFGLGLYLCRVLSAKHGGSLKVENLPDGGAKVTAQFNILPSDT